MHLQSTQHEKAFLKKYVGKGTMAESRALSGCSCETTVLYMYLSITQEPCINNALLAGWLNTYFLHPCVLFFLIHRSPQAD